MKFETKLPKSYYKYADIDPQELPDDEESDYITASFSIYIACKLEQLALKEEKPVQDVLKEILIGEGVLSREDVSFSGRKKRTSKFLGDDCNNFKDVGGAKLYRIVLTPRAKAKVMKKMLELGMQLSFFFMKSMIKKGGNDDRYYAILKVTDLGY